MKMKMKIKPFMRFLTKHLSTASFLESTNKQADTSTKQNGI